MNALNGEKDKENKPEEELPKIPQPPQPEFPKEIKHQEEPLSKGEIGVEEKVKEEKALPKEGLISEAKTKRIRKRKKRTLVVYKSKMIKIDGKRVLVIPSSFEIKTADGWRPLMMRWDKSHG